MWVLYGAVITLVPMALVALAARYLMRSQAAMAPFIEESRVGIAVNGLSHIKERLNSLSEADYQQMRQNAQAMGRQLAEGYYIKQGLAAADTFLKQKANS